jgi:hypothetical protein
MCDDLLSQLLSTDTAMARSDGLGSLWKQLTLFLWYKSGWNMLLFGAYNNIAEWESQIL